MKGKIISIETNNVGEDTMISYENIYTKKDAIFLILVPYFSVYIKSKMIKIFSITII